MIFQRKMAILHFAKILVAFLGYPGQQRAKVAELSKFGRPVSH